MSRGGVLLAAAALVGAVWLSLVLSQSGPAAGGPGDARPATPTGAVPGFLEGAWYLPDDELLGFVEIPPGPFLMGSDPALDPGAFDIERWSAERPRGTVDLPRFFIGRYEVTVAQYAAFVAATGHRVADPAALAGPPDHPVASVSWTDALAYTRWLDGALRASDRTPGALRALLDDGWRVGLPSEAEWEKAARGTDGRVFPWGDWPLPNRANFQGQRATPVGTFGCPECPFELYDMSGNVWEWTRSPDQPYPYDAADDARTIEDEALWIMRGGSYGDPARFVRAANRGRADPGARRPFIGFRIALTLF